MADTPCFIQCSSDFYRLLLSINFNNSEPTMRPWARSFTYLETTQVPRKEKSCNEFERSVKTMINLRRVKKEYHSKQVLENFSLKIEQGEMIGLMGPSGCGKSTILNILGLIEDFEEGEYALFKQTNIKANTLKAQKIIREKISYLFQNFALIETETVSENLRLALTYTTLTNKEKGAIIETALKQVGLKGYQQMKVFQLSGGEQQRVAIARSIVKPSVLLLADEPTGSLDEKNRDIVLRQLVKMNQAGKTIVIVTHDQEVIKYCSRVVYLS